MEKAINGLYSVFVWVLTTLYYTRVVALLVLLLLYCRSNTILSDCTKILNNTTSRLGVEELEDTEAQYVIELL